MTTTPTITHENDDYLDDDDHDRNKNAKHHKKDGVKDITNDDA